LEEEISTDAHNPNEANNEKCDLSQRKLSHSQSRISQAGFFGRFLFRTLSFFEVDCMAVNQISKPTTWPGVALAAFHPVIQRQYVVRRSL
jgi:hypothetical protein